MHIDWNKFNVFLPFAMLFLKANVTLYFKLVPQTTFEDCCQFIECLDVVLLYEVLLSKGGRLTNIHLNALLSINY